LLSLERQRWFDAVLGRPACWLLTLQRRLTGPAATPSAIRRVLVVLLSEMGALVLTQPMFDHLRARYPGVELFVLCSAQNRAALDLLDLVPAGHIFVVRTGSLGHLVSDSVDVMRRIRALRIDAVLDAELFTRVSAIFSALSAAPIVAGFHRHTQEGLYRGDFINRPVLYNPYQHIATQFLSLAEAIGSETVPKAKRIVPRDPPAVRPLALRPGEIEQIRDRLFGSFPELAGKRIVFLCPGGGLLPLRAWPVSHYEQVARELSSQGLAVAIIGLPHDKELARSIQAACGGTCVDLTGHTASVRDLTALLHLGSLLITNDGGTGHFAALTSIPTIVLFGPETPQLYGSLAPGAINLHQNLSCSPCLTAYNHRRSPCDGDNVCLKSIAPAQVLSAAYRLLAISTPVESADTPALPPRAESSRSARTIA
jgi:ADP-heptose:LPS heptosyltransferase